jgi:hypothetical protein
LRERKSNKIDRNRFLEAKRRYREGCREKKKQKGEGEERDKGNKNRKGDMQIYKPQSEM